MKTLTVILFEDEREAQARGNGVSAALSALPKEKEFCGIWWGFCDPEIRKEVVKAISTTVNYFIDGTDKTEILMGLCEADCEDVLAAIHTERCEIRMKTCDEV